jgi:uncharacterized protein YebE (UPF0316 family)
MLSGFQDPNIWLIALSIFALRVVNIAMDTVRMLTVMRGMKWISFILGILVSLTYLFALGSVLSNFNNILLILAYTIGFAAGGWVGMLIEERLALGYVHISVVSSKRGEKIAHSLRRHGHAVTEIQAQGKDGAVALLEISVQRKHMNKVRELICKSDDKAFITTRDIQPLHRGFWLQEK